MVFGKSTTTFNETYSSQEQIDNGRDESEVSKCGYLAWKRPEEADHKEQEDEIVRELILVFDPIWFQV